MPDPWTPVVVLPNIDLADAIEEGVAAHVPPASDLRGAELWRLRLDFGGVEFLIDPYLAEKDAYPGFEGTANSHIRNPRLPLRTPMEDILGVDAVIVTHTHPDHWDEAAVKLVPKHLPPFAQHEKDAELIRSQGFRDVLVLTEDTAFSGVSLVKAPGQHGSDQALAVAVAVAREVLGDVCGVVFKCRSSDLI